MIGIKYLSPSSKTMLISCWDCISAKANKNSFSYLYSESLSKNPFVSVETHSHFKWRHGVVPRTQYLTDTILHFPRIFRFTACVFRGRNFDKAAILLCDYQITTRGLGELFSVHFLRRRKNVQIYTLATFLRTFVSKITYSIQFGLFVPIIFRQWTTKHFSRTAEKYINSSHH